jgi:two-component system sensor histidine kinase KdpD
MPVQPALDLAVQLGAAIETTTRADAVAAVLESAARLNVAHIVLARPPPHAGFARRIARLGLPRPGRLAARLARGASAYTLHIVPDPIARPIPRRPHDGRAGSLFPYALALGVLAAATAFGFFAHAILPHEAAGFMFTAIVVTLASRFGRGVGLFAALASFLLWNFFFLPPIFTLSVADPRDVMALVVFLAVGVLTGSLAGRVRKEAETARLRIEALRRVALFGRTLAHATDVPELAQATEAEAEALAGTAKLLRAHNDTLTRTPDLDEAAAAAAEFAFRHRVAAGTGTMTLPAVPWRFLPLATESGTFGVLGVRPEATLTEPQVQALGALADQAAMAIERLQLAARAAEARAQERTQRLRTALLSSISHDLRTPLTVIRGAAETLASASLPEATRADLLASIVQDVGRMTRFLANITGMARIETGEIVARRVTIPLPATIEAAVARVPEAFLTTVNCEAEAAIGDPALLEQVVVNLLENALKFSPPGAPINVSARQEGDHVVLQIADEGVGIPPADLPRVFDSFFRSERGDRVAPGTGLGLAIARAMVEVMGGRITALSPRPNAPQDGAPGSVMVIELAAA